MGDWAVLLDDLADYLSSGTSWAIGGLAGPIFKGLMPESPDAVIAMYETGGQRPAHTMNASAGRAVVERPRVQVVCRGSNQDYNTARANAHRVFKLFDGLPARSINGVAYKWGEAVHSPFLLGRDQNGRPLIACNYDIVKEMTP